METKAAVVLPDQAVTERESRAFFIIKAFAIFSVLVSHLSNIICDGGIFTAVSTVALEPWAIMGVPIFITVSGFFYRRGHHDTKAFWKKEGDHHCDAVDHRGCSAESGGYSSVPLP
jgi:hypothetical protein